MKGTIAASESEIPVKKHLSKWSAKMECATILRYALLYTPI
jgi:hypothetical protein